MRILWVKPGKLLPLDSGGKLRSYNILRQLATHHEVTYFSFYNGEWDKQYEEDLSSHFLQIIPLVTGRPELNGVRKCLDYARSLSGDLPYSVGAFFAPRVRHLLTELLDPGMFDVAVCDFLASSPNFPENLRVPTLLFQHNVEMLLWERRARCTNGWGARAVARVESRKMARYEVAQLRRFHHVVAVSEEDRRSMGRVIDLSRISVVPTGVDVSHYRYDPNLRPTAPLVVFTGSMDWEPNIDGVEYFCRNVWPLVLLRIPDARFRIVGRRPSGRVTALRSPSVEVTGTVSSIEEHLRQAKVIVVPLRIGGGTRIKIYEGMAMGKATVSTFVGAEGLDVTHGQDILLADDDASFAGHVVELISNESLRRRHEQAAAVTARKYDWPVVTRQFEAALQKVVPTMSETRCVSGRLLPQVS